MTKEELESKVTKARSETHDALKMVWDELNKGQQQKILKNKEVEKLLKRYGVIE